MRSMGFIADAAAHGALVRMVHADWPNGKEESIVWGLVVVYKLYIADIVLEDS